MSEMHNHQKEVFVSVNTIKRKWNGKYNSLIKYKAEMNSRVNNNSQAGSTGTLEVCQDLCLLDQGQDFGILLNPSLNPLLLTEHNQKA